MSSWAVKGITDVRQLKGKIFGVSSLNAGDHIYSQAVLWHFRGSDPNDVTWLAVGGPASSVRRIGDRTNRNAMESPVTTLAKKVRQANIILSADDSPTQFVSSGHFCQAAIHLDGKQAGTSEVHGRHRQGRRELVAGAHRE